MCVKINVPKHLQNKTDGKSIVEVEGTTLYECIEELIRQYPSLKGEILDDQGMIPLIWMVYVNNESSDCSNELSRPVKEGDMIKFLHLVDGG